MTVLARIVVLAGAVGALVPPGSGGNAPKPPVTLAAATPGNILVAKPVENKKKERRRIMSSPDFLRNNGDFKTEKAAVAKMMLSEMKSSLLDDMRDTSYETTRGRARAR